MSHAFLIVGGMRAETAAGPAPTGTRELTPSQDAVLRDLMARGGPRPTFDPLVSVRLRDLMEGELAPLAHRLGRHEVVVTKHDLSSVLQCERRWLAGDDFAWSLRTAAGSVAHRAIAVALFARDDPGPLELVDGALERIIDEGSDWGPAAFLCGLVPTELAELRAEATTQVTGFLTCFPPVSRSWRPAVEARIRVDLCEERIVLKGRVDLSLGQPVGTQARVLLVDLKAARPFSTHVDDLRYYALLEAIRTGVPPFRVASFYLDAGRWQHEDVTEDVLLAAARRVVQGVRRMVDLRIDGRAPQLGPGPACAFCPEREDCPGPQRWEAERSSAGRGLGVEDRIGSEGTPVGVLVEEGGQARPEQEEQTDDAQQ
jgi:hypothetical protein